MQLALEMGHIDVSQTSEAVGGSGVTSKARGRKRTAFDHSVADVGRYPKVQISVKQESVFQEVLLAKMRRDVTQAFSAVLSPTAPVRLLRQTRHHPRNRRS